MAPLDQPDHNAVERQLKDVIQILYEVMIQTANYDSHTAPLAPTPTPTPAPTPTPTPTSNGNGTATGTTPQRTAAGAPATREVLASQLTQLSLALRAVHGLAAEAGAAETLPSLPYELMQYVEGGRNPDIYTREFVELVRRQNQLARGKMRAFAAFRDVLAAETARAMPELAGDVARVVCATAGRWPLDPNPNPGPGSDLNHNHNHSHGHDMAQQQPPSHLT